jgi:hypothetical protein
VGQIVLQLRSRQIGGLDSWHRCQDRSFVRRCSTNPDPALPESGRPRASSSEILRRTGRSPGSSLGYSTRLNSPTRLSRWTKAGIRHACLSQSANLSRTTQLPSQRPTSPNTLAQTASSRRKPSAFESAGTVSRFGPKIAEKRRWRLLRGASDDAESVTAAHERNGPPVALDVLLLGSTACHPSSPMNSQRRDGRTAGRTLMRRAAVFGKGGLALCMPAKPSPVCLESSSTRSSEHARIRVERQPHRHGHRPLARSQRHHRHPADHRLPPRPATPLSRRPAGRLGHCTTATTSPASLPRVGEIAPTPSTSRSPASGRHCSRA